MSIAGFGKPQPPRAGARTGCGPYIGRTFVTVYPGVDRGSAASLPRGGLDLRLGQFLAVELAVALVIASAGAGARSKKTRPNQEARFLVSLHTGYAVRLLVLFAGHAARGHFLLLLLRSETEALLLRLALFHSGLGHVAMAPVRTSHPMSRPL